MSNLTLVAPIKGWVAPLDEVPDPVFAERILGDGLAMDGRAIGGNHLLYGRVPRFGRGGAFIGYYYPDPSTCYQYPGDYSPAVGCYGLEPSF